MIFGMPVVTQPLYSLSATGRNGFAFMRHLHSLGPPIRYVSYIAQPKLPHILSFFLYNAS